MTRLTLDEACAAVRENAPKVLNETAYKERIALTEEESRASAIEEAIEQAAALLVDDYDPAGVLPLENAARAQLRMFSTTCSESALSMSNASSKGATAGTRRPPKRSAWRWR